MQESKQVFSNIYDNFGFGSTESRSGPGSTLAETEKLRIQIINLIKTYDIKSITDFPCGDLNWIQHIFEYIDNYSGCDIVEECISTNKKRFTTLDFYCLDLCKDIIPASDLLIVRDVLGHQPIDVGMQMVNNIISSDCKYLLSTTWANFMHNTWSPCRVGDVDRENEGVDFGRFYPVNLMGTPFNLPAPDQYLEEDVKVDGFEMGNRKALCLWEIDKIRESWNNFSEQKLVTQPVVQKLPKHTIHNMTIVSGLWDIGREGREWSRYEEHFDLFLKIPCNMVLFVPKSLESYVLERRSRDNTLIKLYELEDIKHNMFSPFWDRVQDIRTSEAWQNITGENGWLKNSPQCKNEYYNPIVMSKMPFLHDAKVWNPFDTDYFIWLDAGITQTVNANALYNENILSKITDYLDPFLFLSYPYEAANEIHGFDFNAMNSFAGEKVDYVCRGGLFGGHKDAISDVNSEYYGLLDRTIGEGYMGTEESVFSIMAKSHPEKYRRFALEEYGMIGTFINALEQGNVSLEKIPEKKTTDQAADIKYDINKLKTNLYMLTFNFPEQPLHTIKTMEKASEWLKKPDLILLDNSTDEQSKIKNQQTCKDYGFEYIDLGSNTGIGGGRQAAAEHFDKSNADYMLFFEDDMTVNPPEFEGQFCRNGFRKYIPGLYDILHKIMIKEKFDYLKLSFTEVYFDNDKQCSWYNVPQDIRTKLWPHYDQLPIHGLDSNCPRTKFNNIGNVEGVSYIDGEVYYANWPMIVSKEGNKKMFIDTKWAHPYEQTWMSHIHQKNVEGDIKSGVLLASPIWHDRIMHYKPEERREN